jgi:hypothetical protein
MIAMKNFGSDAAGFKDRFPLLRPVALALARAMLCMSAACSTTPSTSPADTADAATAARVKRALAADPRLSGRQIEVAVNGGIVHLSGIVESTRDLLLVEEEVKSLPGVVGVDEEQLAIRRGGTPP